MLQLNNPPTSHKEPIDSRSSGHTRATIRAFGKKALPLLVASLLTACGGGGGDSAPASPAGSSDSQGPGQSNSGSSPAPAAPPPFNVEVEKTAINVDEASQTDIIIRFSGAGGDVDVLVEPVATEPDAPLHQLSVSRIENSEAVLLFDASDISTVFDESAYDLTVSDGLGRTHTFTLEFSVLNVSALPRLEQILDTAAVEQFVVLEAEQRLLNRLNELGAFVGNRAPRAPDNQSADLPLTTLLNGSSLREVLDQASANLNVYNDFVLGEGREEELIETNQALVLQLGELIKPVNALLEEARLRTDSLVGEIHLGRLAYDPDTGTYSQFVGNSELGAYSQGGEWLFNQDSTYLTAVVFPQAQTCDSE